MMRTQTTVHLEIHLSKIQRIPLLNLLKTKVKSKSHLTEKVVMVLTGVSCLPPQPEHQVTIMRNPSGPAWELFITDDIIQEVMRCTNLEGQRVATAKGKEWKNVNKNELMAFSGLTILAESEKNWDVSVRELFGSPLHNPMYKATIAIGRFEDIRCVLRFDDKRTRSIRLEANHMAAFHYVWDLFLVNCRQ